MPNGTWIITNSQGGHDRGLLHNLRIVGTSTGYNIKSPPTVPGGEVVLASSTSLSAPITFTFPYQGWNWNVTINNLNPRPSGSWSNNNGPNLEEETGTWESGVGGGEEGEEGDAKGKHSAD